MTKRNANGYMNIRNLESRITLLNDLIIDGEDAEAVFKYAYKIKKEADEKMLQAVLQCGDIEQLRSDYRAICHLVDVLKNAAVTGKQKEKTLAKITS